MVRLKKKRMVRFAPDITYFKPRGVPLSELEEVELTVDELEALRLVDFEDLDQTKAAKKMEVSQSTLQRILASAHKKISEALVLGKAIRVKGGDYKMPRGFGPTSPRLRGTSGGGGRGRMGGPFQAGPGGVCVCTNPDCKNEVSHQVGQPCYQMKCPKCGSPMIRKR